METPTQEELTEIIYEFLKQGQPPREIRKMMRNQYSLSYAETNKIIEGFGISTRTVFNNSGASHNSMHKGMPEGKKFSNKAMVGLAIMGIGIVITVGSTINAFSNPEGGRYIIAWGAIIFGGIMFVREWLK